MKSLTPQQVKLLLYDYDQDVYREIVKWNSEGEGKKIRHRTRSGIDTKIDYQKINAKLFQLFLNQNILKELDIEVILAAMVVEREKLFESIDHYVFTHVPGDLKANKLLEKTLDVGCPHDSKTTDYGRGFLGIKGWHSILIHKDSSYERLIPCQSFSGSRVLILRPVSDVIKNFTIPKSVKANGIYQSIEMAIHKKNPEDLYVAPEIALKKTDIYQESLKLGWEDIIRDTKKETASRLWAFIATVEQSIGKFDSLLILPQTKSAYVSATPYIIIAISSVSPYTEEFLSVIQRRHGTAISWWQLESVRGRAALAHPILQITANVPVARKDTEAGLGRSLAVKVDKKWKEKEEEQFKNYCNKVFKDVISGDTDQLGLSKCAWTTAMIWDLKPDCPQVMMHHLWPQSAADGLTKHGKKFAEMLIEFYKNKLEIYNKLIGGWSRFISKLGASVVVEKIHKKSNYITKDKNILLPPSLFFVPINAIWEDYEIKKTHISYVRKTLKEHIDDDIRFYEFLSSFLSETLMMIKKIIKKKGAKFALGGEKLFNLVSRQPAAGSLNDLRISIDNEEQVSKYVNYVLWCDLIRPNWECLIWSSFQPGWEFKDRREPEKYEHKMGIGINTGFKIKYPVATLVAHAAMAEAAFAGEAAEYYTTLKEQQQARAEANKLIGELTMTLTHDFIKDAGSVQTYAKEQSPDWYEKPIKDVHNNKKEWINWKICFLADTLSRRVSMIYPIARSITGDAGDFIKTIEKSPGEKPALQCLAEGIWLATATNLIDSTIEKKILETSCCIYSLSNVRTGRQDHIWAAIIESYAEIGESSKGSLAKAKLRHLEHFSKPALADMWVLIFREIARNSFKHNPKNKRITVSDYAKNGMCIKFVSYYEENQVLNFNADGIPMAPHADSTSGWGHRGNYTIVEKLLEQKYRIGYENDGQTAVFTKICLDNKVLIRS